MKKLMPVIVLAIILSFGVAYGQDITYSVGLKAWVNSWDIELKNYNIQDTSDPMIMIGPIVSIKKGKLFGGLSYLVSINDYEWGGDESSDRTDLDLIAGYMFIPRLGVFIGYKQLASDWSSYGTYRLVGPGFGVTGNYPVPNRKNIVLYGSLSYMFLDFEWNDNPLIGGSFSSDADGASIELGAAYIISANLNASIGFKYQSFDIAGDQHTFSGLTFGANYRF